MEPKNKKIITHYVLPAVSAALLLLLFVVAIYRLKQDAQNFSNQLIVDHIEQLSNIFKRIDASCKIIDFEHEKNYIDFLNVSGFVGSEVGSMNLAHAERWEGPYLKENPTMQEQQYVIVVTPKGHYIAPGDGVRLANGKVIGRDIILDKNTDFEKLIKDPETLQFDKRPMAALIKE